MKKEHIASIGLLFITFLAAIQYIFLRNVPDSVSTFTFIVVTNLIGVVLLGVAQPKKVFSLNKRTLLKGLLFSVELTGFNVFLLLGSRNMDSVMVSSIISLYFVFVTPILVLCKKKVNFFSTISTILATIALVLMFGADFGRIFSTVQVIYLIISDIFFAAYVVSVSLLGSNEDAIQLSFSQMLFSVIFAFLGWIVEFLLGKTSFSLPHDYKFWVSALFMGIFIRVLYGVIQMACQKYVSPLKAALIFASEIIITLVTNPLMCKIFNFEYTRATNFQIIGCVLFIMATLMIDPEFMGKLGYEDLSENEYETPDGKVIERSSVSKKMIFTNLSFSMITLVASIVIFMLAIHVIRDTAVEDSKKLGNDAARTSSTAMMNELEDSIRTQVNEKTILADEKLEAYSDAMQHAVGIAEEMYNNRGAYPEKMVLPPNKKNAGKWTMQRTLADESIPIEDLEDECMLFGNMEAIFDSIVANNDNITTIYLGTEDGLLLSYDTNSDSGEEITEGYYEFRERYWFVNSKDAKEPVFSEAMPDDFGRGLSITCYAPFHSKSGKFLGCIGMDILINDINSSIVNEGISDPSAATLIDNEGKIIAGKNIDSSTDNLGTIFDEDKDEALRKAADTILEGKNGITKVSVDDGKDEMYIAYSTIDKTGWILCIVSPVSAVIEPANEIWDSINENTETVVGSVVSVVMTVIQGCLVLSAVILILVTLSTGRYSKRITDPLKILENDVRQISDGNFDLRTNVNTNDEIGSLAMSFNHMTDSLQQYIVDLKDVTAKEQRIASELNLAADIQAKMLPTEFNIFPKGSKMKLFASMDPAKEVGGDFYDFFMIDDKHLALVMADVSGKGVPASLFMSKAMTSIKTRAMMGGSLSEILYDVNIQMCERNEANLFVTVWMAIIDLETGKGIAANAGHEHPTLRRAGGKYELVEYRHSMAVAAMEGVPFRQHEFELHSGDSIFVYTDGAPEATNKNDELFGTDRLLAALNVNPDADPEEVLKNVNDGINKFIDGADQFDDLTMLCFKYVL